MEACGSLGLALRALAWVEVGDVLANTDGTPCCILATGLVVATLQAEGALGALVGADVGGNSQATPITEDSPEGIINIVTAHNGENH